MSGRALHGMWRRATQHGLLSSCASAPNQWRSPAPIRSKFGGPNWKATLPRAPSHRNAGVRLFSSGKDSGKSHRGTWFAVAALGVGGGYLISLDGKDAVQSEHTAWESVTLRVAACVRGVRTLQTVVVVAADYKMSLRGLEHKSLEYKEALSACHQRSADRLLELCRRQAGVYIKAGQHISSLRPVIPPEITETLACLCDDAPQSELHHVRRIVREELGMELEEAFESFEPEPIGCASLAQVHRAKLRPPDEDGGKEASARSKVVAVKVQHIWMSLHTSSDLLAMEWAAWGLEQSFAGIQVKWILPLFRTNLSKELDFRLEALNSRRCASNFKHDPSVKIPDDIPELTSRRVLTMEFIDGIKVDDVPRLVESGFDPVDVANAVTNAFGEMIFSHGFVHCDPHPGNLLVRSMPTHRRGHDGEENAAEGQKSAAVNAPGRRPLQIVLLDHGLYREIEPELRLAYCKLWEAMVLQDKKMLAEVSVQMGVGDYAALFPIIFTSRSITSSKRLGDKLSKEERRSVAQDLGLRGEKGFDFRQLLVFVESLPRDLLFIIRTQNLVRALCSDLGYPARRRFRTYARLAANGTLLTLSHSGSDPPPSFGLRVRQWARWFSLEVRMLLLEAGLWFASSLGTWGPGPAAVMK